MQEARTPILNPLVVKILVALCLLVCAAAAVWAWILLGYERGGLEPGISALPDLAQRSAFIRKSAAAFSALLCLALSGLLFYYLARYIHLPIQRLISRTRSIARGNYSEQIGGSYKGILAQLALAVQHMAEKIGEKHEQLNRQRDEYQSLFEQVPCLITVQDRDFRLIRYNRQFAETFHPEPGDFCYHAYKGRNEKCENCPVEMTFEDGEIHYAEETAVKQGGDATHWVARATPIRDSRGRVVAAMETSLDITLRKLLERKLLASEKNYREIFNKIPVPVFVLDTATLRILDANASVKGVYGYDKGQIIGMAFADLFPETEKEGCRKMIINGALVEKARHMTKGGRTIFVDISVTLSDYEGKPALLVITSDVTKRLDAERQLMQAGKMATVGEMATGVAHELNQPLSVIKTASSFLAKKIRQGAPVEEKILERLLEKMDANVDRATRIITHMRQFGRMSDLRNVNVSLNRIWESASEMFIQQLKVRNIELVWNLAEELPPVSVDPDRMEQVFVNLILNARDAIEAKRNKAESPKAPGRITVGTFAQEGRVVCEVRDTGSGIAQDLLEKIFEPFFTTKEVGKGSGLGLSISYGIVKDCGGEIRALSESGEGACFIISFPEARDT